MPSETPPLFTVCEMSSRRYWTNIDRSTHKARHSTRSSMWTHSNARSTRNRMTKLRTEASDFPRPGITSFCWLWGPTCWLNRGPTGYSFAGHFVSAASHFGHASLESPYFTALGRALFARHGVCIYFLTTSGCVLRDVSEGTSLAAESKSIDTPMPTHRHQSA